MDFRYFVVNIENLYGLALVNINTARYYTKLYNPYLESFDIWSITGPSVRFSLEKPHYSIVAYISFTAHSRPVMKNYVTKTSTPSFNHLILWTP